VSLRYFEGQCLSDFKLGLGYECVEMACGPRKSNNSPTLSCFGFALKIVQVCKNIAKVTLKKQVNHSRIFSKVDAMQTYIFSSVLQQ